MRTVWEILGAIFLVVTAWEARGWREVRRMEKAFPILKLKGKKDHK